MSTPHTLLRAKRVWHELPCGCWELNSGPLEEQPMLLSTEPCYNPDLFFFCLCLFYLRTLATHPRVPGPPGNVMGGLPHVA